MNEKKYRCYFCKYHEIEHDVFRAQGDDHPPRVREAIDELMREKDATDNRKTELLRKLLDEHGARYEKPEDDTTIYYDDDGNRYTYNVNPDSGWAQLFGYNLTPEQAIAATLGDEREAELVRAMEDVLRHATDTVWVSKIETLVDRMVSLGVYGCEVYEGARPWEVD